MAAPLSSPFCLKKTGAFPSRQPGPNSPFMTTQASADHLSTSPMAVWNLTWPQVLMTYIIYVMNLVPVLTAGHLSADIQAALGMVIQCLLFLTVLNMGLAAGATAAISQALGAGLAARAKRYITSILAVSALLGCAMGLAGWLAGDDILQLVHLPESTVDEADSLFGIYMVSLPFAYIYTTAGVVFRAAREVLIPLLVGTVICLVHAFVCLGTSFGLCGLPEWGADGIAWASVAANAVGACINCALLVSRGYLDKKSVPPLKWLKKGLPYLVKVTVPAFLSHAVWYSGYLVLFILMASVPTDSVFALAGLTAGLRIEGLLFMPGDAFSMSASILVGNCLGAGLKAEARRTALSLLRTAVILMSLAACAVWPFREDLAQFMSTDPLTQSYIVSYLNYNLLSTPFSVGATVLGGVLTGAGATKLNFLVFTGTIWLLRLPAGWFLGHHVLGTASGIFIAMLASQAVQALILLFLFHKGSWMHYAMQTAKTRRRHAC